MQHDIGFGTDHDLLLGVEAITGFLNSLLDPETQVTKQVVYSGVLRVTSQRDASASALSDRKRRSGDICFRLRPKSMRELDRRFVSNIVFLLRRDGPEKLALIVLAIAEKIGFRG